MGLGGRELLHALHRGSHGGDLQQLPSECVFNAVRHFATIEEQLPRMISCGQPR